MNFHPQSYIVRGFCAAGGSAAHPSALPSGKSEPILCQGSAGLGQQAQTLPDRMLSRSCGCAGQGGLGWMAINGPEVY